MDFTQFFSLSNIVETILVVIAFLIAIIGHEIMHGYIAYKYGDDTAKNMGRLSINPIKHIDILGSIIFPLILFFIQAPFLFGWAKPVPVDMNIIIQRHGYMAGFWVSLAGVIYNLILALVASSILFSGLIDLHSGIISGLLIYFLGKLILLNVILGIFNLWPIPPLDGSQALNFLCLKFGINSVSKFFYQISPYGMIIVLIVLATPLAGIFFYPAKILLDFLLT